MTGAEGMRQVVDTRVPEVAAEWVPAQRSRESYQNDRFPTGCTSIAQRS